MPDLSCQYLGLQLKNPIIVGSSGLSDSVVKVKELESFGAGAIVLKSIFEEEISLEYEALIRAESDKTGREEFLDYLDMRIRADNVNKYIEFIKNCKKEVDIPIIASINCSSAYEWSSFAKEVALAGADAIELNAFILPSNPKLSSRDVEKTYHDIVAFVTQNIQLPVALKISYYFSNLAGMIQKLSGSGLRSLVLFNRFYSPDFDIDKMEVRATHVLSEPGEIALPLRWIAMMSDRVDSDLCASTGVSDGRSIVKLLLAGATAVQTVSSLYRNGPSYLTEMIRGIEKWMQQKEYHSVDEFRGLLSQARNSNPAIYERVQFMKYFSDTDHT